MTILAGKGGGTLKPGRYLKYGDVVMSNLWMSMMERMGVKAERCGDRPGCSKVWAKDKFGPIASSR